MLLRRVGRKRNGKAVDEAKAMGMVDAAGVVGGRATTRWEKGFRGRGERRLRLRLQLFAGWDSAITASSCDACAYIRVDGGRGIDEEEPYWVGRSEL